MKILLLGDVGGPSYYHVGDEAIMSARVDWLRENFPEAELLIYSKNPAFTKKIHHCSSLAKPALLKKKRFLYKLPWKAIAIFSSQIQFLSSSLNISKLEQLTAVFQADLLWFCGGGNINSSCSSLIQLRTTLAHIAIACNVPIIVTGQTLGPKLNYSDSKLLKSWFPKVKSLGVRDQRNSVDLAKLLGVSPERIRVSLDDAFWLETHEPSHTVVQKIKDSQKPIIGLSFYYRWGQTFTKDAYVARLASLVDRLILDAQCIVLALPHTYSASSFSDVKFAQDIRKQSKYQASFWIVEDFLIDREIKYLTSQCDYVFSNRFHGIIFAMSQGVPCTAIYQEQYTQVKLESAYKMINVATHTISINAKEEDIAKEMLEHWHARLRMREILTQQLEKAYNDKQAHDEALRTLVSSSITHYRS